MTQSVPVTSTSTTPYEPSANQLARAAAIRRFNRLYVYTPLVLGGLIILVLLGLMLWVGLAPQQWERFRPFFSGLADIIIIFTIMPMMLLCSIGPISLIALGAYRYQKRKEQKESAEPAPPAKGVQLLLWRLDAILDKTAVTVRDNAPKAAKPVIQFHAFLAYAASLLKQIRTMFSRS